MLFAEGCIALIIKDAIHQRVFLEILPDMVVAPIQDRENSGELRPTLAAWANWLQVLRPGVCSTVAHDDCLDALFVY